MFVDVHGLRIAYERAGDGPPVVLAGGYVGDGRGTWKHQLDALSDSFTVVAWDMPGSGRSDDPPEDATLADFADLLAGFVRVLDLARPHLVGLSFGGGLVLELYRRYPLIVRSIVLAAAYAGWSGSLPPGEVQFRLNQVLQLADRPAAEFARAVAPTMFSSAIPEDVLRAFERNIEGALHPVGLRAMARSFAEADLRAVLPRIEVPTLLLYGDEDVRAPLNVAREIHAAIPGSRLAILDGVGHVSSVEAPQRFTEEVRAFLRDVDPR
jgi:pimeloyl-ACP methyl ester carboxylesterase